jgi:ubiquinone/menaquinone biosynthesis C-methylase UbiE
MTTSSPESAAAREYFENFHRDVSEPWSFSERAAEILRHDWIAATVLRLDPAPRRTLDIGCSLGQLTARLAKMIDVYAIDVSPTALMHARQRVSSESVVFLAGTATDIPIASERFDIAVASDGLYSWNLSPEDRTLALRELHRVLRPRGQILLTEHMRPERFAEFIAEVRASPLRVLSVGYLYDRPWYQFESWLRAVQGTFIARALRRNLTIARVLQSIGRHIGPIASRHICVLAMRDAAPG